MFILSFFLIISIFKLSSQTDDDKYAEFNKFMAKNREQIEKWEAFQVRACKVKVSKEKLDNAMKECLGDVINSTELENNSEAKELYLKSYNECKEKHPFEDICDLKENKARTNCYLDFGKQHYDKLNDSYHKENDKYIPEIKELYNNSYNCFETKITEEEEKYNSNSGE